MATKLIIGREDIQNGAGLCIMGNQYNRISFGRFDMLSNHTDNKNWIPNSAIVKGAVSLMRLGLTNYQDMSDMMESSSLFKDIVGYHVSPETFRQRFNFLAKEENISQIVDDLVCQSIDKRFIKTRIINGVEYYVLHIDVTPFEDSDSKKEGIGYTYKGFVGFSPIMAYIGDHSLALELRPGTQHSENGAVDFLKRCFSMLEKIGIPLDRVIVVCDSAHDAEDFIKCCLSKNVHFIIARNPRREDSRYLKLNTFDNYKKLGVDPIVDKDNCTKDYFCTTKDFNRINEYKNSYYAIFRFRVTYTYKDTHSLLELQDQPVETKSYWTDLAPILNNGEIDQISTAELYIEEYKKHATSEQFHGEIKTDLNAELLPSHYFATNKLYLQLLAIAFNLNRNIGDEALEIDQRFQHHKNGKVERIRMRTVIDKILNVACKVIRHAHNLVIKFGRNCLYFDTIKAIYQRTL